MKASLAPGRGRAANGVLPQCMDAAPKSTPPKFFTCSVPNTGTHGLSEPNSASKRDNGLPYKVDWARIDDLFESKYTRDFPERHAAAITKVCRQYVSHYNGIPYVDLPHLTPFVSRLVTGFHQGKSEYGLALRELCVVASKPFVARKVSEAIIFKDAVLLFVVTLCQAAGYEDGDSPAAFVGCGSVEGAASLLHDDPFRCDAPAPAGPMQDSHLESTEVSCRCDSVVVNSAGAHSADCTETSSSSSSSTPRTDVGAKPAGVHAETTHMDCSHAEAVEMHTPSSQDCSFENVESGCRTPAHTPLAARGIQQARTLSQISAVASVDDGNGDSFAPSVNAKSAKSEIGSARDSLSAAREQQTAQTESPADSQSAGKRETQGRQNGDGSQYEAVRRAVFDFLRAQADQTRTLRHISSKSDSKGCKTSPYPASMTSLAHWPFELPAFLPVLNLVKTAFLHSQCSPGVHSAVLSLLLDLSGYKGVATCLLESSLFGELLRQAHFDARAAADFPSCAAYTEYRGRAIETLLNLAECTVTEAPTYIASLTVDEASKLVESLESLLRQLYESRTPFEIFHLRNDLLCTLMLFSKHKPLLPFFASSSLLRQIIDHSCQKEIVHCVSGAGRHVLDDGLPHDVQAGERGSTFSGALYREDLCGSAETSEGNDALAVGSAELPAQVVPAGFQDVESVRLCWATIVNCMDDTTCKEIIQDSTFLRTVLDFIKAELNAKEETSDATSSSRVKGVQHRVLFMQAVTLLSPALQHLADAFLDLSGLPLLLHIMKEQLFPNLMDTFLHALAHTCLVSSAAVRARALLLADNRISAVDVLICCLKCAPRASGGLLRGSPATGLPLECGSDFLSSRHCAALLLAALCCDSHTAREQFRQHRGPSALVDQLEAALASMNCVPNWTSIAYVFCLSECFWATITDDPASTRDYLCAGGVRVILEALRKSPKLLQRHLLGCLTEFLRDDEAVQVCRNWRATDTKESAMELLVSLWERDQHNFSASASEGCIADVWKPLNSQEMKNNGTPGAPGSSAGRMSALAQAPRQCAKSAAPTLPGKALNVEAHNADEAGQSHSKKQCPLEGSEERRRDYNITLHDALLLAATSRRGEEARCHLNNVLEQTVFDCESKDIRLDLFCAIESLTRGFCAVDVQLTTQQKQQVELMKIYPSCCQLEMWGDVERNLQDAGVQPTDVDLHWMETEISELYSISSRVKDTQKSVFYKACSEDTKAVNEFYNQVLHTNARRKV